ncbi:erythromycin esterase family protein [Jeongeupia naejangsanensis]|uniref:Erythromycin esterase family protein n=1 Tax=Jeongeupia naejangsanensis TaxID=613195 RepID=A0ABS2BPN7_9NEIS|nr:erythromycin esterase family protein [Jeongeupia naejangsanensis]MBM3116931.1 erythromycin esterase family protein [Jeongeupia naejangsanensis]
MLAITLVHAAEPLPSEGTSGRLEPKSIAVFTLPLQAGELVQLDLAAPGWVMDVVAKTPDGTRLADYTTSIYGTNSYTRRFIAPDAGMYGVSVQNWSTSETTPFMLKITEQKGPAEHRARMVDFEKWLSNAAQPLTRETWQHLATEQLATTRIVGLGEPSHGGTEFWQDRLALTLALARTGRLHSIAIELPHDELSPMNGYIQGDDVGRRKARAALQFPLWQADGVMAFFDGLREYNTGTKNKVRLVGIDPRTSGNNEQLLQFIAKVSPADKEAFEKLFDPQWASMAVRLLQGKGNAGDAQALDGPVAQGNALLASFSTNETDWIKATSPVEYEYAWLATNARTRMLADYRKPFPESYSLRDKAMAEVVTSLERKLPPREILLVLCHNAHISKSDTGYLGNRLGNHLSEKYGKRYIAIAGSFGRGKFSAIEYGSGYRVNTYRTAAPPPETLESYLDRSPLQSGYLLPLSDLPEPARGWFSHPMAMRNIPADSNATVQERQFETVLPSRDFDYLVFHKTQTQTD